MLRTLWNRLRGVDPAPCTDRPGPDPFAPCANCGERPVLIGFDNCQRCRVYAQTHPGQTWRRDAKGVKPTYYKHPRAPKAPPAVAAPVNLHQEWGRQGAAAKKAKAATRAAKAAAATTARQARQAQLAAHGGTRPALVATAVAAGATTRTEVAALLRVQVPGLSLKAVDMAIWKARAEGRIVKTAEGYAVRVAGGAR